MYKSILSLIPLLLVVTPHAVYADKGNLLDEIRVTSTRQDKVIQDVESNITVVTDKEIRKTQAKDVKDVFTYEPGVNFEGAGRIGVDDVRIRGVGDGRVQIRIDGLALPDSYRFGPFQNTGRQQFDVANLKQAEIIRGPSSSLYGSRAIGGVVSFTTKDPEDFFIGENTFGGNLRTGYASDDLSKMLGGSIATKITDELSALLSYTYRNYHETKIHSGLGGTGSTREKANPEDNRSHDVLAKLVFEPNASNRFKLTGQVYDQQTNTKVLDRYGASFRGTTTDRQTGVDTKKRKAISLQHDFSIDSVIADSGYWQLYYQDNLSEQSNELARTKPTMAKDLDVYNSDYRSESYGLEVQLDKNFNTGLITHELVYGFSYKNQDIETLREFNVVSLTSGVASPIDEEKGFPNSSVKEIGIFIQDRIGFAGGKFEIIPGLRYDRYKLDATADAAYLQASSNVAPADFDESELSFRLGALYHISDVHTIFANYNQGFRAPAFSDANVGFTNLARGYGFLPNPNLKPEKSEGVELGWRTKSDLGYSSLSAFYTQYDDFIDTVTTFNPTTRFTEFQNINLDKSKIYGIEFSGELDLNQAVNAPQGLKLKGSLAYAKGKDKKTGESISSIDPLAVVVGLAYDSPSQVWGVEAITRASKAKKDSDISTTDLTGQGRGGGGVRGSAGHATVDLLAYYNIGKAASINLGVYNAFDKKYTTWNEARALEVNDRTNRQTSTGRYFAINFNYDF